MKKLTLLVALAFASAGVMAETGKPMDTPPPAAAAQKHAQKAKGMTKAKHVKAKPAAPAATTAAAPAAKNK